jgi:hypothetical protein
MNEMLDYLKVHAEHQILKYAVSKQMFCPVVGCGNILDYRKVVIIEFTNGQTVTMCDKCFKSEAVQVQVTKFAEHIKEITKYRKAS